MEATIPAEAVGGERYPGNQGTFHTDNNPVAAA